MAMNVRTLCLGILTMRDATGYEIKKMVEEGVFSHFIDASFGSIYPALGQMLKDGLVSVRAEEQQGKPGKKVYSITAQGRAAFALAVNTDPARDKFKSEFLFQMLFMDLVSPEHLAVTYDAYLEEQEAELARIEDCGSEIDEGPGSAFVQAYGKVMMTTAIRFLKDNREDMLRLFAEKAGKEKQTTP